MLENNNDEDGLPPIFKTWRQMYLSLLGYLVLLIALFYWFSVAFR
jgi:hypothetical protein